MRYYDCGGYPLCSREVLALPALHALPEAGEVLFGFHRPPGAGRDTFPVTAPSLLTAEEGVSTLVTAEEPETDSALAAAIAAGRVRAVNLTHPRYEELLRSLLTLASSDSYVRDMEIAARLTELLTCLMEDAWKPEPERNGSAKRLSLTRVRSYIREMEARCRPRIAIPFSTGCAAPFQGRLFADRRGNLPMRYGRGETAA